MTMNFDVVLANYDSLLQQELCHFSSLVSLQLEDGSLLFILVDSAGAMEHLLEDSQHLLLVDVLIQSLDQSQALSGRSLLEVQVHDRVFLLLRLVALLELVVVYALSAEGNSAVQWVLIIENNLVAHF